MYCEKCGASIPDQSKYCPKCGAPIVESKQAGTAKSVTELPISQINGVDRVSTQSKFEQRKSKLWWILLSVAVVAVISVLLFWPESAIEQVKDHRPFEHLGQNMSIENVINLYVKAPQWSERSMDGKQIVTVVGTLKGENVPIELSISLNSSGVLGDYRVTVDGVSIDTSDEAKQYLTFLFNAYANNETDLSTIEGHPALLSIPASQMEDSEWVTSDDAGLEGQEGDVWNKHILEDEIALSNYLLTHAFTDASGNILTFKRNDENPRDLDSFLNGQLDHTNWSYGYHGSTAYVVEYGEYSDRVHLWCSVNEEGDVSYITDTVSFYPLD